MTHKEAIEVLKKFENELKDGYPKAVITILLEQQKRIEVLEGRVPEKYTIESTKHTFELMQNLIRGLDKRIEALEKKSYQEGYNRGYADAWEDVSNGPI